MKKGRDRWAVVALAAEALLITDHTTQPRPVACPAEGDLRLTEAGPVLSQPRELRCEDLIDSAEDAPVMAGGGLGCSYLRQHQGPGKLWEG